MQVRGMINVPNIAASRFRSSYKATVDHEAGLWQVHLVV